MKMLVNRLFHQQQNNIYLSMGKVFLILVLGLAFSQSFAQLEITRHAINSGVATSMTGGSFEVSASIGQTDASNKQTGGAFSLNGGFWHAKENTPQTDLIFKNGFE